MPEIKIRHGLAFYKDSKGVEHTAFRAQVIDVSQQEAERLKGIGAAVDADEELSLNGRIMPLPNMASDEELMAWASVASAEDIAREIKANPGIEDRLLNAQEIVRQRLQDQSDFLNGKILEASEKAAHLPEPEAGAERNEYDNVVQGNVGAVSQYLSENPIQHKEILDAEVRRAEAEEPDKQPRQGVIRAVEAAAQHTAQ